MFVALDRFGSAPLSAKCISQVMQGVDVIGAQVQGPAIRGLRFREPPLVLKRIAQVVVGFCVARVERQGLAKASFGGLDLVELLEDDSQVVSRLGKSRRKAQSLLVVVGRLVERFLPLPDQTEKEPGLGRARSRSQNGRASLLGAGQVALLECRPRRSPAGHGSS